MYTTSIILIDWQNKITMLFQKVHLECYYYCTFKYVFKYAIFNPIVWCG